jgi:hypothetical protein
MIGTILQIALQSCNLLHYSIHVWQPIFAAGEFSRQPLNRTTATHGPSAAWARGVELGDATADEAVEGAVLEAEGASTTMPLRSLAIDVRNADPRRACKSEEQG